MPNLQRDLVELDIGKSIEMHRGHKIYPLHDKSGNCRMLLSVECDRLYLILAARPMWAADVHTVHIDSDYRVGDMVNYLLEMFGFFIVWQPMSPF